MSFVGTRPEVVKYVKKYKPEYWATLLLPAGITSEASIRYKDEAELLDAATDVDKVYVNDVLPGKMKYNLESIKKFSFQLYKKKGTCCYLLKENLAKYRIRKKSISHRSFFNSVFNENIFTFKVYLCSMDYICF